MKSFRYNQLVAEIKPTDFVDGIPRSSLRGLTDLSRRRIEQARRSLSNSGLILIPRAGLYIINVPELIKRDPNLVGHDIASEMLKQWELPFKEVCENCDMTMESMMDDWQTTVKKGRKRELKKLEAKPRLSPTDVFVFLELECERNDEEYREHKTEKLLGQARNWLKHEDKPKAKLKILVAEWHNFYDDIRTEHGHKIMLSPAINFEQYYKFRREIDAWLYKWEGQEDRYAHIPVRVI